MASYRTHVALTAATRANSALTVPATTAAGDIILVLLSLEDDVTPTAPAGEGYSQFLNIDNPAQPHDLWGFWKRADAGDAGQTHTFTHASTWAHPIMVVVQDALGSGDPTIVSVGNSGTGTTWTALAITTNANAFVAFIGASYQNTGGKTPPANADGLTWTERYDGAGDFNLYLATANDRTTSGTTNSKAATGGASVDWVAALVAIKDTDDGGSTVEAFGAATGQGSVAAIATAQHSSNAAAAGVASPAVVATAQHVSLASAAGVASVGASATVQHASTGAAAGQASVGAIHTASFAQTGAAAGQASAGAVAEVTSEGSVFGAAVGTCTVSAVATVQHSSTASAAGVAAVAAVGEVGIAGYGAATGGTVAGAVASVTTSINAYGAATGTAAVEIVATVQHQSYTSAAGIATVSAVAQIEGQYTGPGVLVFSDFSAASLPASNYAAAVLVTEDHE